VGLSLHGCPRIELLPIHCHFIAHLVARHDLAMTATLAGSSWGTSAGIGLSYSVHIRVCSYKLVCFLQNASFGLQELRYERWRLL